MTVCLCGNINQDIIFSLDRFPAFHEKVISHFYYIGQGGSAANTAWWLGMLGIDARIIGCVGRDRAGEDAINELRGAGVDTSMLALSCRRTGIATIMSCGQDKRMIKVNGANEDLAFRKEDYEGASHIHLSSVGHDFAYKVLEHANRNDIRASWDPSERVYPDLVEMVDFLFLNEDDLRRSEALLGERMARNIVVTRNGGGCTINHDIEVPTLGRNVADTTGAGDAFDAGFIYGLESCLGLEDCGRWGVACSSLNVSTVGARDGFLSKEELEKMIDEGF
ncbi:MAG: carbohydrate kinase family protein [Candidatus Methanofastidiosa archaeon]|nr:carbohydrate kinase family protein [Candidatus Methanofastidiosa archaeon]